jgi:hypothetical protein
MPKVPVFISWSGRRSKAVANTMRLWLEDVLQGTRPWMSGSDIDKGTRWGNEIAEQLRTATIGIICVTPENLTSPWLLFEAGALSKLADSYVCTLLMDIAPGAVPSPLGTFQATQTIKDDVLGLISTINAILGEDGLTPEQLGRIFARSWPELEQRFAEIKALESETPGAQRRDPNELLEELTQLVRGLDAKLTASARHPDSTPYPQPPSSYPQPSGHSPFELPRYPGSGLGGGSGTRVGLGSAIAPAGSVDHFISQTKEAVAKAEQERGSLGHDD